MSDYNYRGGSSQISEAARGLIANLNSGNTAKQINRKFERKAALVGVQALLTGVGGGLQAMKSTDMAKEAQAKKDKAGWIESSASGKYSPGSEPAAPEHKWDANFDADMNASISAGQAVPGKSAPGYAQQMDYSAALGQNRKPLTDEANDALKRSKANSAAEAGPVGGMYTRDGLAAVDETASSTARDLQTGYGGMRQGGMLSSLPRKMWTP